MIKRILTVILFLAASCMFAADTVIGTTAQTLTWVSGGGNNLVATFSSGGGATATGGTITTNGGYIIHTFTNVGSDNFVVSGGSLTCDVLVVAGGGGGSGGSGGGLVLLLVHNYTNNGTVRANGGVGGTGGLQRDFFLHHITGEHGDAWWLRFQWVHRLDRFSVGWSGRGKQVVEIGHTITECHAALWTAVKRVRITALGASAVAG
ncbi:MAG: hypothetical protein WCL11_28035 [Verrucomicrobiota bacterium]